MTDSDIDTLRARAEELLLLRMNGRIATDEQEELDALLDAHPEFAEAEEFLAALKTELAARESAPSPGEFGLARLKRAIAEQVRDASPKAASKTETNVVTLPARVAPVWRYAAIAAMLLLTVQTVGVFTNPEGVLRLAGGPGTHIEGPVFTVAFVPEASETEIRTLLISLDLSIISGPSALGLYQVAALMEVPAEPILNALDAAPVVESVERK